MRDCGQWKWHLDEMYVKLNGEVVYLWRAVDHESEILESLVTKTRDQSEALAFIKKALDRDGKPYKIDYARTRRAMREPGKIDRREMGCWAKNRVENSYLLFRRRERAMLQFTQMKRLQKFASVHSGIRYHFNQERYLVDRQTYKTRHSAALAE